MLPLRLIWAPHITYAFICHLNHSTLPPSPFSTLLLSSVFKKTRTAYHVPYLLACPFGGVSSGGRGVRVSHLRCRGSTACLCLRLPSPFLSSLYFLCLFISFVFLFLSLCCLSACLPVPVSLLLLFPLPPPFSLTNDTELSSHRRQPFPKARLKSSLKYQSARLRPRARASETPPSILSLSFAIPE